jgi:4-amino-4-deoxy-L-arabinose transferase-like glycosyltransferase
VLATSMEMRRGGPWLVPTLQGEPRIAKPPLAAWITAAAIGPRTLRDIDSQIHFLRERGFLLLALEARLPALISACLLLLGVFELGRFIRDSSLGLGSTAICASSYFLLRFARYTTTDIQLALWVTWGNVFLAKAVLRGKWWSGCIGAGIALALAMMSKGPVSLVQSVVPFLVFWWIRKRIATTRLSSSKSELTKPLGRALLAGLALFLGVGLWWYAVVLVRSNDVIHRWFSEVTRIGATETPASSIFAYLGIVAYVVPWTVFFLVGCVSILRQVRTKTITYDLLPLLLLVVPLLIMAFAKDRQDRYTLPMIPAAAIVAAIGVRDYLAQWRSPDTIHRVIATLHWATLGAIAVIFPMLGSTMLLKQSSGQPWFTMRFASIEAALGFGLLLAGILLHRTRPGALVAMTFVTMLVMQAVLFKGYCTSDPGRSDLNTMADVIAARYPDATFYNAHPKGKRPPTDLGVYLNRAIYWTADASHLQTSEHPTILFMLQNKGEPIPTPPEGWHFVERAKRDKDWWWAFVLPPS